MVENLLENLASDDKTVKAAFIPDRCLKRRLHSCECRRCIEACPAGAVWAEGGQIGFGPESCTGCMQCSSACPNDAFEFSGYDPEMVNILSKGSHPLFISCPRQEQVHPEEHLVPCLGGITIEQLLALGLNEETIVTFNVSSCSACENNPAITSFRDRVQWLKNKGGFLLKGELVVLTEMSDGGASRESGRRSFLSGLKNNLLVTIGSRFRSPFEIPKETAASSRRIPARVRLKKLLFNQIDIEAADLLSALIDHRLAVSDACTSCPLCKGICPTGAIKVERFEGQKELAIDSSLCSGCGLCVTFCPHYALSLKTPISWSTGRR